MSKPTNQELMKAVADVLDEALAEYEKLSKAELGIDGAQAVDDMKVPAKPVGEPGIGGPGQKPLMAKEEAPAEPVAEEKEKEDEEDEKEDDEKLMQTYKSLVAKMEKRGLMHKEKHKEVKKSETSEERFEALAKAIKDVSETVKKIATAPAARKSLAGYAPLRKSEEAAEGKSLRKSEIVSKLLELKKSGTEGIDTALINRVETSRLTSGDVETIKSLGILG